MINDLIIITACTFLLVTLVYGIKTRFKVLSVIALVLVLPPILITLVINISVITSPITPKVHGKVIDAETNKPLAGINVKAGWVYGSDSAAGGGGGGYYKIYETKTDANGEYTLPRWFKTLRIQFLPGFPLSERSFRFVRVTFYPSGYEYKVRSFNYPDKGEYDIALEKVKTDKDFLDNINSYWLILSTMHKKAWRKITDAHEKAWLKNAYYQFEKLYPNSKQDEPYLRDITNMLDTMKEPDCVYVLQRILDKYPTGQLAWYAKNNIATLKRIYGIK